MRRTLLIAGLVLACARPWPAMAHGGASDASVLSALPVAMSVTVPAGLLVAGSTLTVVAVEAASGATVWVLERASDGARMSVRVAGAGSAAVGASVVVTAVAAGWVLSVAGEVLCLVPNELGRALLHDERITR